MVAKVSAAVLQSEIHRIQRTEHPPADAWEHFIKGINETGALDPGKYENARWHLEQAIEIDPEMAEGNNEEALEAVNRAMFINQNIYHTPTAVAVLYVAGDRAAAARLYNEMRQSYPYLSPRNPLLYTFFKPIDEILARQRELGEDDGPADVDEIYRVLSQN